MSKTLVLTDCRMEFSNRRRILCVDDSQDTRELILFILSNEGYEVQTAGSVAEGMQIATANEFDIYLIDLSFADGTGFDLIKKIREFNSSSPIVVCSGNGYPAAQDEAVQSGAQVFLLKPIEPETLVHTVAQQLKSFQTHQRL